LPILIGSSEVEMPRRTGLTRRAILSGSLGLILAGCDGGPEIKAIASDERGLKELGEVYRYHTAKKQRAPKTLKELNIKGQQFPIAVEMIKSGDVIVQWGAPLSTEGEPADAVLAYVKSVPEQGGNVLMQDGKTLKKMTAEEFRAAPKAGSRRVLPHVRGPAPAGAYFAARLFPREVVAPPRQFRTWSFGAVSFAAHSPSPDGDKRVDPKEVWRAAPLGASLRISRAATSATISLARPE
jgi:hypothetical protein